jgi:hypothetical protein
MSQGPWLLRRLFPLLATVGLIIIGMAGTIWGPRYYGKSAWALPDDLWGTMIGAQRLVHLNLSGLYTPPTQLVSLPGAAVILIPVVALIDAAGLRLGLPDAHAAHPGTWLLAGPYEVAISAVVLFAADAIAERLGVTRPRRFLLAAASATALWSVTIRWGHPEDAVATGLLLYAILALSQARTSRAAWLAGAAVAVQPLVLLAFPVLVFVVGPRRLPGFLARAAAPGVLLLAIAAAANWTATIHAVTSQPNSPRIDHPTPWIYLAPRLPDDQVAAGPARILALVAACGCGLLAWRTWRSRETTPSTPSTPSPSGATGWSPEKLQEVLWWTAVALALRSAFEPVMVAYYLWPPLAVALIPASRDWTRLLSAGASAVALTFFSQIHWQNPWAWWTPMIAILALTLFLARPRRASQGRASQGRASQGRASQGRASQGRASQGRASRRQLDPGGGPRLGEPAQVLPEPGEQFIADGAP